MDNSVGPGFFLSHLSVEVVYIYNKAFYKDDLEILRWERSFFMRGAYGGQVFFPLHFMF